MCGRVGGGSLSQLWWCSERARHAPSCVYTLPKKRQNRNSTVPNFEVCSVVLKAIDRLWTKTGVYHWTVALANNIFLLPFSSRLILLSFPLSLATHYHQCYYPLNFFLRQLICDSQVVFRTNTDKWVTREACPVVANTLTRKGIMERARWWWCFSKALITTISKAATCFLRNSDFILVSSSFHIYVPIVLHSSIKVDHFCIPCLISW